MQHVPTPGKQEFVVDIEEFKASEPATMGDVKIILGSQRLIIYRHIAIPSTRTTIATILLGYLHAFLINGKKSSLARLQFLLKY